MPYNPHEKLCLKLAAWGERLNATELHSLLVASREQRLGPNLSALVYSIRERLRDEGLDL